LWRGRNDGGSFRRPSDPSAATSEGALLRLPRQLRTSAGWEIVMGKRFAIIIIIGLAVWLVPATSSACDRCAHGADHAQAGVAAKASTAQLGPGEVRVTIPVAGMSCSHCVSRVEAALAKLEGVRLAEASLEHGEAVVVFEKAKLAPAKLVETIDALGYKAGAPAQN